MSEPDVMNYDAVVVGAGPAGIACAIRLRQLDPARSVCVLEKGASIGAHLLSGALHATAALDALLPDWRAQPPQICVPVRRDEFRLLTARRMLRLPTPPQQRNHGNFIISLGQLAAQLAARAEALGVDVFPGFAVSEALFDAHGAVAGVALADMGRRRDGSEKSGFVPGAHILSGATRRPAGDRVSTGEGVVAMPLRYRAAEIAAALGQPPPTSEQIEVIESAAASSLVVAGAGSGTDLA